MARRNIVLLNFITVLGLALTFIRNMHGIDDSIPSG